MLFWDTCIEAALIQAMKSQKRKANATYRNTLERNCSCSASGVLGAGAETKIRVNLNYKTKRFTKEMDLSTNKKAGEH